MVDLVHMRRRVGARLVARAFERAAQIGGLARQAKPEHHGLERIKDVAYGARPEHLLDVYRPRDADNAPVVFYVHGGAFASLSKNTHWIMGLAFARRGFVVAMPDYRLSPEHRFPAHLEDTAAALRFVVDNARSWGGDPSRIIFAGESAGANLVTSLALCQAYERDEPYARIVRDQPTPLAVLAACGVFEVTNTQRFNDKFKLNWFIDDRFRELEMNYPAWENGAPVPHDLMNPLLLVEREAPKRALPPFFLPVGGGDHLRYDHERLEAALKRHGVDVEAPVYGREPHAFHAFVLSKNAQRCWRDHWEFLARHGVPVRDAPAI
ncbi:MAG TPA: alpha/beta hydrolase [Myxococcota bacterium]